MKKLLFLLALIATIGAKAQSCDTFTVAGRSFPVYGIIESYPTANDTVCWYWNRAEATSAIAYAAPVIGTGAFSSTTVAVVSTTKAIPGSSYIQVQNITAGNYVWSPTSLVTSTGFTVYDKASASDSFVYYIWVHK